MVRSQLRIFILKIYHIDTSINLIFFLYVFIRWLYAVFRFSLIIYSISLISAIIFILSVFFIDWYLYSKKKGFYFQIIFTVFLLLLFGFVFFLFAFVLPGVIKLGSVVFFLLMIIKLLRLYSIITTFQGLKRTNISTKLSIHQIIERKAFTVAFIAIFLFPTIVFSIGLSSITVASIEIDINNQRGEGKGSNEIQLSFYATLSSYDYLTNKKVLKALNGTGVGDGKLLPVEILLLVADSELKDENSSLKLAYMAKNCTESGLNVWIWFVYNDVEGHYPSYSNHEYVLEFKDLFDEWVENNSLDIYGVLFDNEMDPNLPDLAEDGLYGYVDGLITKRDESKEDWNDAVDSYKTVAEEWSEEGYKIALVGMDLTLIDSVDGDPDIQQMYGIVDDPPEIWDRVSFMFYRSCEYNVGTPNNRDYLYNLADYHKKVYKDQAVVAIGCMSYEAYKEVDDIVKDIALLKHLNYETVELFEFRAFYAEFGYNGLIEVLESSLEGWKHAKFNINFYTLEYISRALLFLLDIFLNFY